MRATRAARLLLAMIPLGLLAVAAVACEGTSGEPGERGRTGPIGQPGKTGAQGNVGQAGVQGPEGARGPRGEAGPAGEAPSQDAVRALVDAVVAAALAEQAPAAGAVDEETVRALVEEIVAGLVLGAGPIEGDAVLGGKLYDDWPQQIEIAPTGEHALWTLQTTNEATGVATWRCRECHGWDYKGALGAYGDPDSPHYTGFLGLLKASRLLNQAQIVEVLRGGLDPRHDFTTWLDDAQMAALAAFLKTDVINYTEYVDYETGKARGEWDADRGQLLYSRTCKACHGEDGTNINFGTAESPRFIGTIANEDPWSYVHKTRFGQPGTPGMPVTLDRGWTIADVIAVLGHSQGLPVK